MPDMTLQGQSGDTLCVRHEDGGLTLVVWYEGGEAIITLPPETVKAFRDRRRWPGRKAKPA
jgi:hypothetical protein